MTCAWCSKVLIEGPKNATHVEVSHGICQDCFEALAAEWRETATCCPSATDAHAHDIRLTSPTRPDTDA